MSTAGQREPTNDELWAQPPTISTPVAGHGLSPLPHAALPAPVPMAPPPPPAQDRTVFALALVSVIMGIPLTAIGAGTADLAGLVVVWTGIVLVNLLYSRSRRP